MKTVNEICNQELSKSIEEVKDEQYIKWFTITS
jgi:hypothetical protein